MKKTDIALIILIAAISITLTYFALRAFGFGSVSTKPEMVKTAEPITTEVVDPDTTVFNKDAINPTVESIIGGGQ